MKIFVNTSKIIENRKIADNYFLMRFENKNKDIPLPGQFINLKVNDKLDPLLRRPFAVFEYSKKDISILYKAVGKTTMIMSGLQRQDKIEYMGFLGKPFSLNLKNKKIGVVAGGIGLSGVFLFLKKIMKNNKTEFFLGLNKMKEADNFLKLLKTKAALKLNIAVMEKNKKYFHGTVCGLLNKQNPEFDILFACGPLVMLKSLYSGFIREKNIPAYFSMDTIMACGIGACMGCTIKIREGEKAFKRKRACTDGPVFKADEIDWDEEIK